jgi:hypothetical protein
MKTRLIAILLLTATGIMAQEDHQKGVEQRGDYAMGFSHDKTTHHFRLYSDGGAIEVTANDPNDRESRDQIRMHLSHIAAMFAAGDFRAPMLIHDRIPPGVPVLQKLKEELRYWYEDMDRGGRVRISTQNKKALAAVYEFLSFQITDHQTRDTGQVTKEAATAK